MTQAPTDSNLPVALIDQYKKTLLSLTDTRLVILLGFSSFEEVMKAFLAWRLGCPIDELPKSITRAPDLLFQLVLVGEPKIFQRTKKLAEIRNNVAHKFHLETYEGLLSDFVQDIFSTSFAARRRRASTGSHRGHFFASAGRCNHLHETSQPTGISLSLSQHRAHSSASENRRLTRHCSGCCAVRRRLTFSTTSAILLCEARHR